MEIRLPLDKLAKCPTAIQACLRKQKSTVKRSAVHHWYTELYVTGYAIHKLFSAAVLFSYVAGLEGSQAWYFTDAKDRPETREITTVQNCVFLHCVQLKASSGILQFSPSHSLPSVGSTLLF